MELLILADDFTGALDTAVQFAEKGIPVIVASSPIKNVPTDVEVLSVNCETRHLDPEEAGRRVEETVNAATSSPRPPSCYYKKTDSLLRGNVGSELSALMKAANSKEIMFVPAFPRTGRTTREGTQLLNGLPVHKTPFAKDRYNPIREGFIPDLLRRTDPDLDTVVLDTKAIRDTGLPSGSRTSGSRSGTAYVFDAESDEDLVAIGKLLKAAGRYRLTAGCAGFAAVLPQVVPLKRKRRELSPCRGPLLVISGSITELSRRQVRLASSREFALIALSDGDKLTPDIGKTERGREISDRVGNYLLEGRDCIITTTETEEESKIAREREIKVAVIPEVIAGNLAALGRMSLESVPLDTVVVFGGDTATAFLTELAVDYLRPLEEILPGIPLSFLQDGPRKLISKSGGFGAGDVLLRIKERVRSR